MSFTPLHVHTEHSSLDGLARIKDTARAAAAQGLTACALTDHGTPAGLWTFAQECKKNGVKPIPGIEVYMAIGSRFDPQTMYVYADDGMGDADDEVVADGRRRTKKKSYYHLTVLAKNRTGWHNLIRFHNESQRTKIGKHPAGDMELLKKYGEGLIVLTGCLASPVAGPLAQTAMCSREDDAEFRDAEARVAELAETGVGAESAEYQQAVADMESAAMGSAAVQRERAYFATEEIIAAVGAENVFVEVMDHGIDAERHATTELLGLSERFDLAVVATNDSHYLECDDDHAHEAFLAVGTGSSLHDESRFRFNGAGYHFKTEAEMREVSDEDWWQWAVDDTQIVADMVDDDTVPDPELRLPTFELPDQWTSADAYLRHLVEAGAARRYGDDWNADDEVSARVDHELSVVADMGYSDYFLITWDIIEYAKSEGITTGPGRGSAAGSIIAYALGITDLCPLRYGLLFERFLERGRIGMPDIDLDFPKYKRHLIHAYCQRKYGADHVAHIGGFNKAKTKAAIKDATRVHTPFIDKNLTGAKRDDLELERKEVYRVGDRLAKIVEIDKAKSQPFARLDEPQTDEEQLRAEEFWAVVEECGELAEGIVELARRFEGVSKNETIHPCGFVISTEPLFDMVPLRPVSKDADPDEPQVIVWDGEMVEEFGLLKMDFLGIQTLDYIDLTFDYLARREHQGLPQTVADIPEPDDEGEDVDAAYDMISAGRTAGLFQLDGTGMTQVVMDIAPDNLNDLSAAVALYRPGPISAKMPEDYAAKKHGRRDESYDRLTTDSDEIDWLDTVLGETFQNVVYQEQAMRLGQVVAGFDDVQRSTLRKAIGKKKQDLMDQCSGWWFDGYGQEYPGSNGATISPVFSRDTAERVWDFIKGAADYAFNKCVTGETVVDTGGGKRAWTVGDLYRFLHGDAEVPEGLCPYCQERPARSQNPEARCPRCNSWWQKFRDPQRGFHLLAADSKDGRIRPQKVKDVHYNGIRTVYKVTLRDGRTVRATGNHRFLTDDGTYCRVDEIAVGETALATHEGYEAQRMGPEHRTTRGPRVFRKNRRLYARGEKNTAFIDGGHAKLMEWTRTTAGGAACDECGMTRDKGRLERAHLDGDRTNNDASNLAWKCVSHHKRWDYARNGRRKRWEKGHMIGSSTVASVEADGVEAVYDVEMEAGTDHNLVANGIISHNSHSAAYGKTAFWTAYLKANYPVEYGAAMLASSDNDEKRLKVLADLKAEGIEIGAPEVNESDSGTVPVGGQIRLGLGEIKDVGKTAALVIGAREEGGSFASLHDLATRVKGINVKAMRALIESGALDAFGPRRGLLKTLYAAKKADLAPIGEDFGVLERDRRQRAVLGTVIGSRTLDHIAIEDVESTMTDEGDGQRVFRLDNLRRDATEACCLGVVSAFKSIISRRGRMAKMTIEDTGAVDVVVWPDAYREMVKTDGLPEIGDLIVVSGRTQTTTHGGEDDEPDIKQEILADHAWLIDDPTWVEDVPVETSRLIEALEGSGECDDSAEPSEGEATDPRTTVPGEADSDDDGDLGHDDGRSDDDAPADIEPAAWFFALVAKSLDSSISIGHKDIIHIEGPPRGQIPAKVDESEPIYINRRDGVGVKLVEGLGMDAEMRALKEAAGL